MASLLYLSVPTTAGLDRMDKAPKSVKKVRFETDDRQKQVGVSDP